MSMLEKWSNKKADGQVWGLGWEGRPLFLCPSRGEFRGGRALTPAQEQSRRTRVTWAGYQPNRSHKIKIEELTKTSAGFVEEVGTETVNTDLPEWRGVD
jgi:hypothetical protein